MKKVLIIASIFPPNKCVGRVRTVKFAKYLPSFGWKPVVLTTTTYHLTEKERDFRLLEEVPSYVKVYRALRLPLLANWVYLLKKIRKNYRRKKKNTKKIDASKKYNNRKKLRKLIGGLINKVEEFLNRFVLIPDNDIVWLLFAVAKGIYIIKKEKIDLIFSTAPAYTDHLIGCILKILTRKPWIADYRDLWNEDPSRYWIGKFRRRIEKKIEKYVILQANLIVVVSLPMRDIIIQNFLRDKREQEKIIVISNGFDPQDICIPYESTEKQKDKFVITYTGKIGYCKTFSALRCFLEALAKVINEDPSLKKKIRVRFIGEIANRRKEEIFNFIRKFNLQEVVEFREWCSNRRCLIEQRKSDVLLLMIGSSMNNHIILTTKLFEYITATRPILALIPEGAAKEVISKTSTGIVVDPNNIEEIKEAIFMLYNQWREDGLDIYPNWKFIEKFNRKYLTQKLAEVFSYVCK